MNMRFSDMTECSIEFESELNASEKQLLRAIYLKMMGLKPSERIDLLKTLLDDGGVE